MKAWGKATDNVALRALCFSTVLYFLKDLYLLHRLTKLLRCMLHLEWQPVFMGDFEAENIVEQQFSILQAAEKHTKGSYWMMRKMCLKHVSWNPMRPSIPIRASHPGWLKSWE